MQAEQLKIQEVIENLSSAEKRTMQWITPIILGLLASGLHFGPVQAGIEFSQRVAAPGGEGSDLCGPALIGLIIAFSLCLGQNRKRG